MAEDGFGPELLSRFSLGEPISGVGGYATTKGWSYEELLFHARGEERSSFFKDL